MFKKITRFDDSIAETGIWIDAFDGMGRTHGGFKCALIDKHTQRWKLTMARMEREQKLKVKRNEMMRAKGLDVEEESDNFAAKLFVELSLLDWRNVMGEDDKEVPFSKEAAIVFFTMDDTQFILEQLYEAASDISNFQPYEDLDSESLEDIEAKLAEVKLEADLDRAEKKTKKSDEEK